MHRVPSILGSKIQSFEVKGFPGTASIGRIGFIIWKYRLRKIKKAPQ
jgi:hypothetical protein